MPIILSKSSRNDKKYMIKHDNKTTHFGGDPSKYRDFTLMNNKSSQFYLPNKEDREKVKTNYRKRHRNDNLTNPYSAGALSYFLLWNKPSLSASIKDYEKKFNINIVNKT
jgi:hypothetical protein